MAILAYICHANAFWVQPPAGMATSLGASNGSGCAHSVQRQAICLASPRANLARFHVCLQLAILGRLGRFAASKQAAAHGALLLLLLVLPLRR